MLGVIGGTGFNDPHFLQEVQMQQVATPYDPQSVQIMRGAVHGRPVAFLPRHGRGHKIPPHRINYRANLWALHAIGVTGVIGVNAVGGLHPELGPGALAVPDQIIDYSWGREHTFFADGLEQVTHIDFTHPYDEALRQCLIRACGQAPVLPGGVYACTQGPRLETAAEIRRLQRDGCDMVGMTGMPEAALARELGLAYACLALSVNWAAGISDDEITMEAIGRVLDSGMSTIAAIVQRTLVDY